MQFLAWVADFSKSALRELLPPVVTRGLRAIWRRRPSPQDPLTIVRHERRSVLLNSGQLVHHRGTLSDLGVLRQVLDRGDYDLRKLRRENDIASFYRSCAEPLIVDCGANIGSSAVWFAHEFPRSIVVAVEPDNANYELLSRNHSGPRAHNVHGAVAGRAGKLPLVDCGAGEWGYRTGAAKGRVIGEVRAYSVDDLVSMFGGTPFILKIDIEGAEADLFATPADVLNKFPLIVIELHDWMLPREASSRAFLKWHAQMNRDFVYHGENVFSISNEIASAAR